MPHFHYITLYNYSCLHKNCHFGVYINLSGTSINPLTVPYHGRVWPSVLGSELLRTTVRFGFWVVTRKWEPLKSNKMTAFKRQNIYYISLYYISLYYIFYYNYIIFSYLILYYILYRIILSCYFIYLMDDILILYIYVVNGCFCWCVQIKNITASQDEDGLSLTSTMIQTSESSRRQRIFWLRLTSFF